MLQGLYYSYFKTMVEADSFTTGIDKLIRDNVTEYPDTINTLKRFNLYPEVMRHTHIRHTSHISHTFAFWPKTSLKQLFGYS